MSTPTELEVDLASGLRVRVRPISPEDRDLLVEGLRQLSDRALYYRFHAVVRELSDEELDYLTNLDYTNHFAWGAVVLEDGAERPAGVARYVRLEDRPDAAELAITVVDRFQGMGVGSLLLEALADVAEQNGIRTFTAYVLSENEAMLEIFDRLGATLTRDGAETTLEMPIPLNETHYRGSPLHAMFKAMAAESASNRDVHRGDVEE